MKDKNFFNARVFICSILFFISSFALANPVQLGDDQIIKPPYLRLIQGKRIGLLVNAASINSQGKYIVDVLNQDKKINLVALFSPEGGIRAQATTFVKNSKDKKTGLPIYSLYNVNRSPSKKEMSKIDVMMIDLQSVGVRYYTFASTLALVMKAAKKYHKEVIVLDRPNPLGGNVVYGPAPPKKLTGYFTSYYSIPMRYGLTIGELARYYNKYFHIGAKLIVVPLKNWRRNMLFPETGLKWSPPSPGLLTFKQAFIYSVLGPLESMNFAVSRYDHEKYFDRSFGATWMTRQQVIELVQKLKKLKLPGVNFKAATWVPETGPFKGKTIHGFQFNIINYKKVRGYYTLLACIKTIRSLFGNKFKLDSDNLMIGSPWIINGIKKNFSIQKLIKYSHSKNKQFVKNAKTIMLY